LFLIIWYIIEQFIRGLRLRRKLSYCFWRFLQRVSMEDSFKGRVDETFGALFGPASNGGAQFWSVRESSMASDRAEAGAVREVESSGSDGDEDNGIRYENFLKLERSKRRGRRRHGEHLEAEVYGQEDLEELESEEEEDDEEEERTGTRSSRKCLCKE
jgi:hypothetical protein